MTSRLGWGLERTVGSPNPVAERPRTRPTSAVLLRSQRNERQAGVELVWDLLDGGRPFDGHGRDAGAVPAPHAATPSKRSDAELVDAAARRGRPPTVRAHQDRPAADILATPAARRSKRVV
jgi:hypothetical protein